MPSVVLSVTGLSEGRQKIVRGDLLDYFLLMTNFLPENYSNKMTTQRLSRYLKVVTGCPCLCKGKSFASANRCYSIYKVI